MYVFKSMADLSKVPPNHPCRDFVFKLACRMILDGVSYNPDEDGYVVLIEYQDLTLPTLLPEVPLPLSQMPWEGVVKGSGIYHGVILTNNQFAIDVIIPDDDWLPVDTRKTLEAHL